MGCSPICPRLRGTLAPRIQKGTARKLFLPVVRILVRLFLVSTKWSGATPLLHKGQNEWRITMDGLARLLSPISHYPRPRFGAYPWAEWIMPRRVLRSWRSSGSHRVRIDRITMAPLTSERCPQSTTVFGLFAACGIHADCFHRKSRRACIIHEAFCRAAHAEAVLLHWRPAGQRRWAALSTWSAGGHRRAN